MTLAETLTIFVILIGPIAAVLITIWFQERNNHQIAKHNLFLTLMAHRKSFPPPEEWVKSLNLIDVVFAKHPKVVGLWHRYHEYLNQAAHRPDFAPHSHNYIELLSAKATALGYKTLQQIDIDKFYTPQFYGDRFGMGEKLQQEFLRVLENTSSFVTTPKEK